MRDGSQDLDTKMDEVLDAVDSADAAREPGERDEFDVEDLPELEAEAEDPDGDLKTAYSELRQQTLEQKQEFMAYRQQADNLIRMLRDRVESQGQRRAPQESLDDDDPWNDQPARQAPVGDQGLRRELSELKQTIAEMRSETQRSSLRSQIDAATRTLNDKYKMPLLDEENIIYEMQKHNGNITPEEAAQRVARRKLAAWKESGIRRVRPKASMAPAVPPGLRAVREYTAKTEAAGTRDELDAQMDAYLDLLDQHNV